MGSFISTAFEEKMKKNQQQFMLDMNQITVLIYLLTLILEIIKMMLIQVERQIQMQNQMRERM